MSDGGLQMVVYLQSQVSLASDVVTKTRRQLLYQGFADTETYSICVCVSEPELDKKNPFLFLIIPNVAQRSATGNVLKQIQMKAETMLIQSAAATPTSSTAASFPSVLIHVKWLHMVTFCFSCQHFCCSQENFGFSFWWSALLRHFSFHWPNFLTVFT